jgi:hypothetical protein
MMVMRSPMPRRQAWGIDNAGERQASVFNSNTMPPTDNVFFKSVLLNVSLNLTRFALH